MNELLIYLLKVIAIQGILYIIYALIFHKSGRHAFNRGFIILALVISFVIPLISVPTLNSEEAIVESEIPIWYELAEFTNANNAELIPVANVDEAPSLSLYIAIGIILVSLFLVIKLIFSHFQLLRLMNQSDNMIKDGYPIYIGKNENPFSYFKAIFIPENLINSASCDTILQHELVHVKQWHSLDRILIEIATSILWMNPFHYLFRNRLIETHEFQADDGVISVKKDPIAYQEILYEQSQTQYAMASANYFKLNTIKTRIKMINKTQKQSKWYYLLILPVFAILTFSFANKEKSIAVSPLPLDIAELFETVLNEADNFTPSIFPLQDAEGVELTVGKGKRIHPILKVERMHDGIDLKTYKGNPVLATADGIVMEAGPIFKTYGNRIIIDHDGIYHTAYAHLSEINVKNGDKVKRGDIIGAAGTTGLSSEPHLHYEVREVGKGILNPVDFIKNYNFKTSKLSGESFGLNLSKPDQKLRVVIDAGHGGKDAGATESGLSEKEIVIMVAQTVAENFKDSDEVEIILTRIQDEFVTLENRVSQSKNADLFISVHVDATVNNENPSHLMSAIYYDGNEHSENSKKVAALMGREFSAIDTNFKAGITAGFIVLKNADCPAISLSIGNISNTASLNYMNSEKGIKEIAQKLSEVIKSAK